MYKNKRELKSIVLAMLLAAGMLLPASGFAQNAGAETKGGFFGLGKLFSTEELLPELTEIEEEMSGDWTKRKGGLFGYNPNETAGDNSWNSRGLFNIPQDVTIGISNADFGEQAPLGSGLVILIGAGLVYMALKKKEDKQ